LLIAVHATGRRGLPQSPPEQAEQAGEEQRRHAATFDNGKEFANHERITHATGIDVYFARPYHAWERGTNEGFNGLLRQFFLKGTDFTGISPLEVKYVHNLLNNRPRKRLEYRTPREVLGQRFPIAFQM